MRKKVPPAAGLVAVILASSVLVLGGLAAADHGGGGGRTFRLELSGAAEVPPNAHGEADRGSAVLRLNPGQGEVCFSFGELTLTAGEPLPFAAHIHQAPPTDFGPVVVPLFAGATAPTSYPTEERCVAADRSVLLDVIRDPGAYYVNLHNDPHRSGVVRSQLG